MGVGKLSAWARTKGNKENVHVEHGPECSGLWEERERESERESARASERERARAQARESERERASERARERDRQRRQREKSPSWARARIKKKPLVDYQAGQRAIRLGVPPFSAPKSRLAAKFFFSRLWVRDLASCHTPQTLNPRSLTLSLCLSVSVSLSLSLAVCLSLWSL